MFPHPPEDKKKKMPAHTTYSMMYMYVHIFTEYKYVQVCIMTVLP